MSGIGHALLEESKRRGERRAERRGERIGMLKTLYSLVEKNLLSKEDAAEYPEMSVSKFMREGKRACKG